MLERRVEQALPETLAANRRLEQEPAELTGRGPRRADRGAAEQLVAPPDDPEAHAGRLRGEHRLGKTGGDVAFEPFVEAVLGSIHAPVLLEDATEITGAQLAVDGWACHGSPPTVRSTRHRIRRCRP